MKKITAIIFLLVAIILYAFLFLRPTATPQQTTHGSPSITKNPFPGTTVSHNVLFVPYWSNETLFPGFQTYVYFSIKPTTKGIDMTDSGFAGLPAFVTATQSNTTLLTVQMSTNDTTEKILQDTNMQHAVIQDSINIAKSYGFDGILLDLEYSGFAFPSVTQSITDFSTRFAKEVKSSNLTYYQTFFGDSIYLARPYDIKKIAQASDGIFILAYDFHKANGTPGPNFPLTSREDADYSFGQMIQDFTKKVARTKITVIFGMFGYDWTIDEKGRPEKSAISLSDADIQASFLRKCVFTHCVVTRDSITEEPSVSYEDTTGQHHIVWWEDMQSITQKETILKQNGISQVGFWANGYF